MEIVEGGGEGIESWDAPAAYEAMARATAAGRRPGAAAEWKARAAVALAAIPDADDRAPIEGDLATIPV